MELTPFVAQLHDALMVAAEAGGEDARSLAERLTAPLDSAARLALLEALSAAAAEITREMAPGSVDVRLRGREPQFVVTLPSPPNLDFADDERPPANMAMAAPPVPDIEEGGTARITLRLPEQLKPRIDQAAGQVGLSVNAWLVRVIAAALETDDQGQRFGLGRARRGQRLTGWVR